MKDLVSQILEHYFKKMHEPKLEDLNIKTAFLKEKWCCFVTLYLNWEVHGSAWNIKEVHPSLAEELISNTIQALTWDKRFSPLTLDEAEKVQYRIDKIDNRKMITIKDLQALDPVKNGVIAIHRNYEKLAVILPNISPKLLTGQDSIKALSKKLKTKTLNDAQYILYQISTLVETNY